MSTTLPPWPPAPLSEAKSPPDDPELVAWARETVFGVIAKYDKASETTTRDRVKHPTDVAKLTTARGRVYRALGKLRATYTSHIHDNAIEDDELHLQVAARNLAALQLLDELDRDIKALTVRQLRAAEEAANNAESQEEEEEGDENEEQNDNPENDDGAAADHQNAADDDATAPDNGAANPLTADGRLEQNGRGQSPRDPVVASVTDPKRPKKKTAAPVDDDPTGAAAVVQRYLEKIAAQTKTPVDREGKKKKKTGQTRRSALQEEKKSGPTGRVAGSIRSQHSRTTAYSEAFEEINRNERSQVNQTMNDFLEETNALNEELRRAEEEGARVKQRVEARLKKAQKYMKTRVAEIQELAAKELAALAAESDDGQQDESTHRTRRRPRSPGGPDHHPSVGQQTSNDKVRQYLHSLSSAPLDPTGDDKSTDEQKEDNAPVKRPVAAMTAKSKTVISPTPDKHGEVNTKDLLQVLLDQSYLNRIPVVEPPVFLGEPLRYHDWIQSFTALVERRSVRQEDRLHYLKKYLGGEALEAVEGFLLLDSPDAYQDAKELLQQRYGDSFTLANAYRDKLEAWPKIQGNDPKALRRYSDFLRQCLAAKESISSLSVLDDDRENHKLLTKLPDWLTIRWARKVAEYQEREKSFPNFKQFVAFVKKESDIVCNPITSLQLLRETNSERTGRTLSTEAGRTKEEEPTDTGSDDSETSSPRSPSPEKQSSKRPPCDYCQGSHSIGKCFKFRKLPYEQRIVEVRERRLCFNCLRKGHVAVDCTDQASCDMCGKHHSTLLHNAGGTWSERKPPDHCPSTTEQNGQVYSVQQYPDPTWQYGPVRGGSWTPYAGSFTQPQPNYWPVAGPGWMYTPHSAPTASQDVRAQTSTAPQTTST